MAIDHDQIFKQLIESFFREFLELFCPDEARLVNFKEVQFLREEHFTDVKRGKLSPVGFPATLAVRDRFGATVQSGSRSAKTARREV